MTIEFMIQPVHAELKLKLNNCDTLKQVHQDDMC